MSQNVPHVVVWFDIPVKDLERAMRFYRQVLAIEIESPDPTMPMGVFQHTDGVVGGCLYVDETVQPSLDGPLLYLNASGRLDEAVASAEACGGRVLTPKHVIGPHGYRAIVCDSEGNRIALHSH